MSDTVTLPLAEIDDLARRALRQAGIDEAGVEAIAAHIAGCERDGCPSHGLLRLPGYCIAASSGRVDGHAVAVVERTAPGVLRVDGRGGFALPALRAVFEEHAALARSQGVAILAMRNAFHFGALWADVEPYAEAGLAALNAVNSQAYVAPFGANARVFGTNPIAFAFPRADGPPLVFDMATSASARGEIMMARIRGERITEGLAVTPEGAPTTDPEQALAGSQLPFGGGHKGASIGLMVELLAAAMTGGNLSREVEPAPEGTGGQPGNAGQLIVAFDPVASGGDEAASRAALLCRLLHEAGVDRLPGDRRGEMRNRHMREGVPVARRLLDEARRLAGGGE
jgi:delta1-piperideine-2-carboxylate reductase